MTTLRNLGAALALLALTAACASPTPQAPAGAGAEVGIASWYGPGFHGRTTASGQRFDMYALTAAHKTLPFGTRVRVTNEGNLFAVKVLVHI